MRSVITGVLLSVLFSSGVFAQSPWLSSKKYPVVTVEFMRPYFTDVYRADPEHPSPFSSYLFATLSYPVSDNVHLILDLPLSHWGYRDPTGEGDRQDDDTSIGNMYAGVELHHFLKNMFFELGTRLPTMPEPDFPDHRGAFTGAVASYDRNSAFVYDYIPIQAVGNYIYSLSPTTSIRFRGGVRYGIYTHKDRYVDPPKNDLYLLYSIGFHFDGSVLNGAFGFSDHHNTSGKKIYSSRERLGMIYAAVEKPFGKYTIGLNLRVPSTENQLVAIDMILGASVRIHL